MIGLDLGTGSCKAVIVDDGGRIVAKASEAYPLRVGGLGQAEQDVADVWTAVVRVLRSVAAASPLAARGIALSGAMHTSMLVEEDGEPLSAAITWADRRPYRVEAAVRAAADGAGLYARTGCPVRSVYFPVRLRWWAETAPGAFDRARRFVGLKDWVLHALTGSWLTDVSMASTTGLLDLRTLAWDEEALVAAGIAPDRLPALVQPSSVAGGLTAAAAGATGLTAGMPVIAGATDGALANLGAGITTPGESVLTVGTSGAVRRIVDRPWTDPSERTWCYVQEEDRWFAGGAINNAGLALDWVRRLLHPDMPAVDGFERVVAEAASIPAGAGGLVMLPYLAGERSPSWTPEDPAMLFGLRLDHGPAHLARAAMEGTAHCLADVWEALPAPDPVQDSAALTGGITRSPAWAQIVADVLGIRLTAVEAADASAVGAAMLGLRGLGVGSGAVPGSGTVPAASGPGTVYLPGPDREVHLERRRVHAALRSTLRLQVAASAVGGQA